MQKPAVFFEQGITVVAPGPDYDSIFEISLPDFDEVLELAESIEVPLIILDLAYTQYFGSAFLSFIVRLSNGLTVQRNGRLAICQLSKFCHAVITAAKMDTLFEVYDSREEALVAMNEKIY